MKIKDSEKIYKYLDLTKKLKKLCNMRSDDDTNSSWYAWNGSQMFEKRTGRNWNQRPSRLRRCWEWSEYWDESWKPKETFYLSDSCEISAAKSGVKNSRAVK